MTDHPTPSPAPASGAETPTNVIGTVEPGVRPEDWEQSGMVRYGFTKALYVRAAELGRRLTPDEYSEMLRLWTAATAPEPPRGLPTPPSDAGTSERETGDGSAFACAKCGGPLTSQHGEEAGCEKCRAAAPASPLWRMLAELQRVPSTACLPESVVRAATAQLAAFMSIAPAAEGPREARYSADYGECVRQVIAEMQAPAALPGAEAGTTLGDLRDDIANREWSGTEGFKYLPVLDEALARLTALMSEVARWKEQAFAPLGDNHHNAALCPYCSPDRNKVESENARLTSEVRALTEQRDAAQAWANQWREMAKDDEALMAKLRIDAARLASPSPTGAPSEQQKHEG